MLGKEKTENYLRTILNIQETCGTARSIDVAEALNVSKPTVSVAIHELEKKGFIIFTDSNGLFLTKKGMETASKIKSRYHFLFSMLVQMGVNEADAKKDACKMEHCMCDESFHVLRDLLYFFLEHSESTAQTANNTSKCSSKSQ
ncbi:metal-dependent transcriptional regulator [Ruminococcus sp.]